MAKQQAWLRQPRKAAPAGPDDSAVHRAGFRGREEYEASLAAARRMLGHERATLDSDSSTVGQRAEFAIELLDRRRQTPTQG